MVGLAELFPLCQWYGRPSIDSQLNKFGFLTVLDLVTNRPRLLAREELGPQDSIAATAMSSAFLSLPIELRCKIYRLLNTVRLIRIFRDGVDGVDLELTNCHTIMSVNKQINDELRALLGPTILHIKTNLPTSRGKALRDTHEFVSDYRARLQRVGGLHISKERRCPMEGRGPQAWLPCSRCDATQASLAKIVECLPGLRIVQLTVPYAQHDADLNHRILDTVAIGTVSKLRLHNVKSQVIRSLLQHPDWLTRKLEMFFELDPVVKIEKTVESCTRPKGQVLLLGTGRGSRCAQETTYSEEQIGSWIEVKGIRRVACFDCDQVNDVRTKQH